MQENTKFCEHCGNKIHIDSVLCPKCGHQVEKLKVEENKTAPQVVITNANNTNAVPIAYMKKECDKWVSFVLCLLLGIFGAHKFYEGKIGLGILYLFTGGLFFIGTLIDLIVILCHPDPYYV